MCHGGFIVMVIGAGLHLDRRGPGKSLGVDDHPALAGEHFERDAGKVRRGRRGERAQDARCQQR